MSWLGDVVQRLFGKKPTVEAPKPPVEPPKPSVGEFKNFAFPVIRRVHSPLSARSLVGIQPMTAPSGGVFTMDLPPRCEIEGHSGFGGLVSECTDPECVVRHVHES